MSRGLSFLVAGAILAGCLAVAGVMVAQRPEPARRPVPSRVPFAVTAPVVAGAGAIPVHGAGTVRPRAQIDVAAEISGRVEWVAPAFQSGGRVRRGQLLFRIDDADYRNSVEQARASVAVQRVELLRVTEEARIARSARCTPRSGRSCWSSRTPASPSRLPKRGYVMETGRIVLEGPASDLRENDKVQHTYLGVA